VSKTTRSFRRSYLKLAAVLGGGICLGTPIPSCETVLTTVNPCGTVFAFCDPQDVDVLFATIPDFELDPTCTIPFYGIDNPDDAGGGVPGQTGTCADNVVFPNTPGPRPQGRN
jgi:hypothetical protein